MSSGDLVLRGNARTLAREDSGGLPAIVVGAGRAAETAWADFFDGTLANGHTWVAYNRAVRRFLAWEAEQGRELHQITAGDVGRYLRHHPGSPPTKKQHIAALRRFFDLLVERHLVLLNPAAVAKTERYQVLEGKTLKISHAHARTLLASLDVHDVVGLRDRAVIATLIYTPLGRAPSRSSVSETSTKATSSRSSTSTTSAANPAKSPSATTSRGS